VVGRKTKRAVRLRGTDPVIHGLPQRLLGPSRPSGAFHHPGQFTRRGLTCPIRDTLTSPGPVLTGDRTRRAQV